MILLIECVNIRSSESQFCSKFKLTTLALIIISFAAPQHALADDVVFNPNALEIDNPLNTPIDLSRFSDSGNQIPGKYHVDIYMNGELKDTQDIYFVLDSNGKLVPQITPVQLEQWGVMLNSEADLMKLSKTDIITDIRHYFPESRTDFDFHHQALKLSIPQASMKMTAQGYVDPKYWDQGITALLLSYSFNGSNSWVDENDGTNDSYFLNLNSGFNISGFRFRNYSTWNYSRNKTNNQDSIDENQDESTNNHWDSINTYVQHDIQSINGQLTAGDGYSPSDVFDSMQFRGIQISSDDNMLPDSLRGFAPTVRGIANSNAQVTIKQNGSIIYQTYVSPGAFVIDDLYPTTTSGDLKVIIKESDGSERTFLQPFSNVPVMQREGHCKYDVTIGKYRSSNDDGEEPTISQATLIYGLPHDITAYGGIQASTRYDAAALGLGFSLGDMGSVSIDATQSYASIENQEIAHDKDKDKDKDKEGQSYRFQYSKDIQATDSTVTLAGYRYSTKGFYTFQETMDSQYSDENQYNKRSKVQINFSQNIMGGDWGSLSFSGYQQDFWGESGFERSASVSYNSSFGNGVSWSVMYTYSSSIGNDINGNDDQQLALSISVPLTGLIPNVYLNANTSNDLHGKSTNQGGISGTALEDNNLSYDISQGYSNRGEGNSGDLGADYKGTYGELNANYNYNKDSRQVNYGAQGSVIVHQHGITFGQPMQGDIEAAALVEVPGAGGVALDNGTGVRTDWRGYTIVPYLSAYKRTRIALDPESLDNDIDLEQSVTTVVPTSGAIVEAKFKASVGKRGLITLIRNGKFVPFGTIVSVEGEDDNTGIIGDDGQVYLNGINISGRLVANWGTDHCTAPYQLPKNNQETINEITLKCI